MHLVDNEAHPGTTTCYEQYAWQTSLRGDRKEFNQSKSPKKGKWTIYEASLFLFIYDDFLQKRDAL